MTLANEVTTFFVVFRVTGLGVILTEPLTASEAVVLDQLRLRAGAPLGDT